MLFRNISKTQPVTLLLLLVIMFIWSVVYMSFVNAAPWIADNVWFILLGGFIYVIIILIIQHTLRKHDLSRNGYLTLLIIVILSFNFPEILILDKILLAYLAHMFMLRNIFNLKSNQNIALTLFDAGIYSGISFLFFPQSILYFLLIIIGYFIYVKIIDQQIFIPFIGFITPVFLWFVYKTLMNEPFNSFNQLGLNSINLASLNIEDHVFLTLKFYSVLILIAWIVFFTKTLMVTNPEDQKYKLLFPGFVIGFIVVLTSVSPHKNSFIFLFLPIAVLLSFWLKTLGKYWLKEVVLWLILLISFQHIFVIF